MPRSGSSFQRKPTCSLDSCLSVEANNLQHEPYGTLGHDPLAGQDNGTWLQAHPANLLPRTDSMAWLDPGDISSVEHNLSPFLGEISSQGLPLGSFMSMPFVDAGNSPLSPSLSNGSAYNDGNNRTSSRDVASFDHAMLSLGTPSHPPPSWYNYHNTAPLPIKPRPHGCGSCYWAFEKKNDLARHMSTVHACGSETAYRCKCGYSQVRKDNYKRHVAPCQRPPQHEAYLCKCESEIEDKHQHLEHVRACRVGAGQPGRPAGNRP